MRINIFWKSLIMFASITTLWDLKNEGMSTALSLPIADSRSDIYIIFHRRKKKKKYHFIEIRSPVRREIYLPS